MLIKERTRLKTSAVKYRQEPELSVVVIDFASYLFRIYLEYNGENRESVRIARF